MRRSSRSHDRPSKRRRISEVDNNTSIMDQDIVNGINEMMINELGLRIPSDAYRPFQVLGKTIWVAANRLCCLRFDSPSATVTTRNLQTWVDVQMAIDSLCKLIGSLPRNESVTVATLFKQNSWNSVMSKSPGPDSQLIIWTPKTGLCTSILIE